MSNLGFKCSSHGYKYGFSYCPSCKFEDVEGKIDKIVLPPPFLPQVLETPMYHEQLAIIISLLKDIELKVRNLK